MGSRLPTEEEALNLLRKSGCSKDVINHCRAVSELAVELARKLNDKGFKIDLELVKVGALLHDIGRSKTHTVDHVIVGSKIAKSLGLPKSLISIIERHAGGGITSKEARELGWPEGVYTPQTLEEKIVCYADKLIGGTKRIPLEKTLKDLALKLGEKHPALERLRKLDEEMRRLLED
ncbi:TIGR00295 family protein [Candidatus Bathyarchaeota archaeon]|nr:MAG: TIGR00295 family protein [Candidatus Bathyarchaeota archaeon]